MYQPYRPPAYVSHSARPIAAQMLSARDTRGTYQIHGLRNREDNDSFTYSRRRLKPEHYAGISNVTAIKSEVMPAEDIHPNSKSAAHNELLVELIDAALDTGSKAFEAQEWAEAELILQEAVEMSLNLPKEQIPIHDAFEVQGKLAICAYYKKEIYQAQQLLLGVTQSATQNEAQQIQSAHCSHLLSQVYLRSGQAERARETCDGALQARRRLLGKQNVSTFESLALMSHISGVFDNRARAKLYLAMIPEVHRLAALKAVELSLQMPTEASNINVPLTPPLSEASDNMSVKRYDSVDGISQTVSRPPASRPNSCNPQSPSTASRPPQASVNRSASLVSEHDRHYHSEVLTARIHSRRKIEGEEKPFVSKKLSRKDILERVGCQPRDDIEEAVCKPDSIALEALIAKKKSSWRSKFRTSGPAERVTALHFAALFGEVDMARRLIEAGYRVNEVPYGYTSCLSPLKFAVGARQAAMVDLLLAHGARPTQNETWSGIAGQLLNRSWLMKTLSVTDLDQASESMVAVLRSLLKHGWAVNAPIDTSGRTILHQAVSFWTGSYAWDMSVRLRLPAFLCEHGADPMQADAEGKTPYDIAATSGHLDLINILAKQGNEQMRKVVSTAAELAG